MEKTIKTYAGICWVFCPTCEQTKIHKETTIKNKKGEFLRAEAVCSSCGETKHRYS